MPRKKSNLVKQVWFRLKPTELQALDTIAEQAGQTRAAMIRFLVLEGLKNLREQTKTQNAGE